MVRTGLIGLGTMGSALALNIAGKGFDLAVWNREAGRAEELQAEAGALGARLHPAATLADLVALIAPPRVILLMIPAGPPVDEMHAALAPLLGPGDVVIDGGNADFHDTIRRDRAGLPFQPVGMGVSGGRDGALNGPSLMVGGPVESWALLKPLLTAIAARAADGTPCAAHLGSDGAGHFVKAVHNGIEYADMQMIAECYGLMRDGLGMQAAEIGAVFADWNAGRLQSFLVEVTATVAGVMQDGVPLIDRIVDSAGQKGTGRWTVIEALHAGAPIPAIDAAVNARNVSARLDERAAGAALYGPAPRMLAPGDWTGDLEQALIAGKILAYAQGFAMLHEAGRENGWELDLAAIARVWRAGCIIRWTLLDPMAQALDQAPGRSLLLAPGFAALLAETVPALRRVVAAGALNGLAMPALGAALAWFDQMRTARGTANLIQAQRDFFGLHGFMLHGSKTGQHGPWA